MRDKTVLVETTILVDYLRGSDEAAEYLDKARAEGDLFRSLICATANRRWPRVSTMSISTSRIIYRYDRRTWLAGLGAGLAASLPVVAAMYWFLRPAAIILDWPVDERRASALKIDGDSVATPSDNPAYIRLHAGQHRIVLLRRGYEPIEWNVDVRLGERIERQVEWIPIDVNKPLELHPDP